MRYIRRHRAGRDTRACCPRDGSLRIDQVFDYNGNGCAGYRHEPESDSWRITKLPHRHRLYFYFQSCNILRTVAAIAMSGPSHLRRKEKINGRDYDGCVCPQGSDSDDKASRADCPTTPFRIVSARSNRDTVLWSGGSQRQRVEGRLQTLPPLSDRKQHHVLSRGKGSTQSLRHGMSSRSK
jgi:hypothetical protein